jgi:hypothetical protein
MIRYLGSAVIASPLWLLTITEVNRHGVQQSLEYLIINSLLTAGLLYLATTKDIPRNGK